MTPMRYAASVSVVAAGPDRGVLEQFARQARRLELGAVERRTGG